MLPGLSPATPSFIGAGLVSEFESPSALFFLSALFFQGGGMDLTRVGERLLSSVASGRSLGILPSDRPQIPARAAAAAAVARALAGLPPHQRLHLPSSSEELISIYGSRPQRQSDIEEIEEEFYEEDFDPVKHVLDDMPSEGNDLIYFEEKANLRLAQLDGIAERLSRHVMEHHEEMVKGMQLVMELEQDLKVANVICMNGRRHLTSSMHEVSRDLVVHSNAKKKQALLDMLPILTELRRALDMQMNLDILVEEGNYFKAFQVLSEYLQVLDSLSELSATQEMSRGVEAWLARTLQKLDSLLLGVCQSFKAESYLTALDAYAIIGDVSGLADKVQSFFMQEILSDTHSVLKDLVQEDIGQSMQGNRFTYSDLCAKIPESKFRLCLLKTQDILFRLMCSYYSIMSFQPTIDILSTNEDFSSVNAFSSSIADITENVPSASLSDSKSGNTSNENIAFIPSYSSPFYQLRKDATTFVARTLDRGRKNFWHLTTSRMSVLLSCSAVCSTSTHQFLRNYEDIAVFILAGEAFCGAEAVEFRQRLKSVCENYVNSFHRQNVYALRMVLEKETWVKISMDASQAISLAGLLGDGAPLIAPFSTAAVISLLHSKKNDLEESGHLKNGFANWVNIENPFQSKATGSPKESSRSSYLHASDKESQLKRNNSAVEDENEDLLADFIDEDSQLPSRMPKPLARNTSANCNDEEISAQTGSSLCLIRLMDKYARLMQKLEIVNIDFFKGISQLFGIFFNFVFEAFCQRDSIVNGKGSFDTLNYRLKSALSKINQDCDQWIRQQNLPCSPTSPTSSASFGQKEVTPTIPGCSLFGHTSATFGLKERCAGAETISLVARVLDRSRAHIQSKLLKNNASLVDDFYENLVGSVPVLIEYIHRTTSRLLLHINGYADRIANAKWEVKELGLDHNGYVDLLLGEFKHYKTRLAHGGIHKEVQDLLLEYGLENVADVLIEGLSRVKRCTDEGRALMSLDLQVLINGLQHFASINVRPKLQVVETFIKAYYLPETEYVHWARSHPEYSKCQVIGLINLVASMKSWKRKTRLEVLERIEAGT